MTPDEREAERLLREGGFSRRQARALLATLRALVRGAPPLIIRALAAQPRPKRFSRARTRGISSTNRNH